MHAWRSRALGATAIAALGLVAAVTLVGGGATTAKAAFPGQNGKIVFQTTRDKDLEIYTMDPDGTNRVNLTRIRRPTPNRTGRRRATGSSTSRTATATTRSSR